MQHAALRQTLAQLRTGLQSPRQDIFSVLQLLRGIVGVLETLTETAQHER
jgi:hypothetical protein